MNNMPFAIIAELREMRNMEAAYSDIQADLIGGLEADKAELKKTISLLHTQLTTAQKECDEAKSALAKWMTEYATKGTLANTYIAQRDAAQRWLEAVSKIAEESPELNPSNYNHDDVCELNFKMIELCLLLRAAPTQNKWNITKSAEISITPPN